MKTGILHFPTQPQDWAISSRGELIFFSASEKRSPLWSASSFRAAKQDVEPNPLSAAEMNAMNQREIDLNLKIAKEAGLKFN